MYLDRALAVSRQLGDSTLTASILNNRGNLLVTQEKNAEAIAAYKESAEIAKQAGQWLLRARALTNAATTLRRTGAAQESRDLLDVASGALRGLEATSETAFAWINVGLAYRDLRPSLPASGDQLLLRAAEALTEAAVEADKIGDRRTAAAAGAASTGHAVPGAGAFGALLCDLRLWPDSSRPRVAGEADGPAVDAAHGWRTGTASSRPQEAQGGRREARARERPQDAGEPRRHVGPAAPSPPDHVDRHCP